MTFTTKPGERAVHAATVSSLEDRLEAWRTLLAQRHLSDAAKVDAVNEFFNRFSQRPDDVLWGAIDHWANLKEFLDVGAGDCEDFALAKYVTLIAMGVPSSRLTLTIARVFMPKTNAIERHMVLVYRESAAGSRWILDNLRAEILALENRSDLTLIGEVSVSKRVLAQLASGSSAALGVRISPYEMEDAVSGTSLAAVRR